MLILAPPQTSVCNKWTSLLSSLPTVSKHLRVKTVKMRTIKLSSRVLLEKLQGKPSAQTLNIPNDAELLDIKYDLFSGQVIAAVRSEAFEDIPETYPIPELAVAAPGATTRSAPSVSVQKTKSKSTLISEAEPMVLKKTFVSPKPKSNTGLMEEEFSMEQRKVLSFSLDGDFVVVKPVKFLKAEWDDINEVVRSIGGRWVKGDIISYWEIPLPKTE
jgi:hypothetical protein